MKVQILVKGRVANTQIVSIETLTEKPSTRDVKRLALKAALEDGAIQPSDALGATFLIFDVRGNPVFD